MPSSAFLDGILLDCGAGATGRLHDLHQFDHVDAILISHLHTDHVAGLFDYLLHTLIAGRRRPLTVVSPPGLAPILRAFFDAKGTVVDPVELYDFRLVEGTEVELAVGPWTVRSVPLDHTVTNLGFLVAGPAGSVFYTGDTREPSRTFDVRADFLIHEATYSDEHAAQARDFGHSTGSEAAQAAVRMGARRLFLNHVGDAPGADAEILREAGQLFRDSVVVQDLESFDL